MENTTQTQTSGNEHNFPQFVFAKKVLAEIEEMEQFKQEHQQDFEDYFEEMEQIAMEVAN